MKMNKKFNVMLNASLEKGAELEGGNRRYRVYGTASTTTPDRQGERLSTMALKKMQDTSILKKIPIFSEHDHSWKSSMGFISESKIKDSREWDITVELESPDYNEDSRLLINKMEHGTPINMSIGGRVLDAYSEKTDNNDVVRVINDLELFEVSFVGIPANEQASVISYIAKSLEGEEKMTEEVKEDVVEETPVEAPVEEAPVEEAPAAEEAPVEEAPVEEVSEEEAPAEEEAEEEKAEVPEETKEASISDSELFRKQLKDDIVAEISKELAKITPTKKSAVQTDNKTIEDKDSSGIHKMLEERLKEGE